jgi:membrane-bound lytic murein transglycosylase F
MRPFQAIRHNTAKATQAALLAMSALAGTALPGITIAQDSLAKVLARGELIVATLNSPTTYYEGANGPAGFEYDLVRAFADFLQVDLKIVTPQDHTRILPMIANGEADLAAGFSKTELRAAKFRFGPAYQEVTPQLLSCSKDKLPATIADTAGARLEIMAASSHEETLRALKRDHPAIEWRTREDLSSDELIDRMCENNIDYTVANSNMVALNRRYYPDLTVAFDLAPPQPLAWAFAKTADRALQQRAASFFEQIEQNGFLKQILSRYYEHARAYSYVGAKIFVQHIAERLPAYQTHFEKAGRAFALDWRLLAAVSYQESLWEPDAVSPTGVRGLMMLTEATAGDLGIEDRADPEQSVIGGAKYLALVKQKVPDRIAEPDRTWLALAAYNIGFGHLEDARILTQGAGGDPDKWMDVRQRLPLLTDRKWYSQTRYGYARGYESVHYVQNIRNYYDVLVWFTERAAEREKMQAQVQPESDSTL